MNKAKKEERLAELRERLSIYKDAERKILQGQSYTIGSRQLTRTSLESVQKMIQALEAEIEALESRGTTKRRMWRGVPID